MSQAKKFGNKKCLSQYIIFSPIYDFLNNTSRLWQQNKTLNFKIHKSISQETDKRNRIAIMHSQCIIELQ